MINSCLFSIVCLLCALTGQAQTIYACIGSSGELVRLDPETCSWEVLRYGVGASDIAFEGGTLYAEAYNIYSLDPYSYNSAAVDPAPTVSGPGLEGDGNGNLYIAEHILARYNLASGVTDTIGSLLEKGYACSGDLAFHGGKLYMSASRAQQPFAFVIVEIQLAPFGVTEVAEIPNLCYGLTGGNLPDSLLYFSVNNSLYQLNMLSGSQELVCDSIASNDIYGMTVGPETLPEWSYPQQEPVVSFYPEDQLVAVFIHALESPMDCTVYDALGQVVRRHVLEKDMSWIDISAFAPGVYFMRLGTDGSNVYDILVPH